MKGTKDILAECYIEILNRFPDPSSIKYVNLLNKEVHMLSKID